MTGRCEGQPSIDAPVYTTPTAGTLVPVVLHGMRRFAPAGWPSVPPGAVGFTAPAFVYRSASGLPSASVSYGTDAGRFVPRRRRYCDLSRSCSRKTTVLNWPLRRSEYHDCSENVRITFALSFLAAAGT